MCSSVCADVLQDVCQSEGRFEHRAAGFGDFKAGLPLHPLQFRYTGFELMSRRKWTSVTSVTLPLHPNFSSVRPPCSSDGLIFGWHLQCIGLLSTQFNHHFIINSITVASLKIDSPSRDLFLTNLFSRFPFESLLQVPSRVDLILRRSRFDEPSFIEGGVLLLRS